MSFSTEQYNKKLSVVTEAQKREPRDLILRRNPMKAGGLIVLISALMLTVSAQTTEPGENLPPRVLRTAEMIGVRSQVEELLQLRSAPKRDDMRELRLAQRLQGVVI